QVMGAMEAGRQGGLRKRTTAGALGGDNDRKLDELTGGSRGGGRDGVLIEVRPRGELGENARLDQYLPLSMVRADLSKRFNLIETDYRTGGPARYFKGGETGGRVGLLTPLPPKFW